MMKRTRVFVLAIVLGLVPLLLVYTASQGNYATQMETWHPTAILDEVAPQKFEATRNASYTTRRDANLKNSDLSYIAKHASTYSNQKPKHGYILTLEYSGQQGAGVRALVSQQCWVKSFNLPMHIVEPFVDNSKLGSVSTYDATKALNLGQYFDLQHFNQASEENGYPSLVSWKDFLQNAPQKAIMVWVQHDHTGRRYATKPAEVFWETNPNKIQCYKNVSGNRQLQSTYDYLSKLKFLACKELCTVRIVTDAYNVVSSPIFSADEMSNVLFRGWKPEEVTLVFNTWRGPWYVPNPQLEDPLVCQNAIEEAVEDKLRPSSQLLWHAEQYEEQFLNPQNSLAVMIRAEHVVCAVGKVKGITIESEEKLGIFSCFKELVNLTRSLEKSSEFDKVFMTSDVGTYASATVHNTFTIYGYSAKQQSGILQAVKDTIRELYHQKWTFEEWENSFSQVTGGIEDRGYIAALQRIIASRAECLVIAGGGTFQRLALLDHLATHPDPCIYLVCVMEKFVEEYRKLSSKIVYIAPPIIHGQPPLTC